MYRATPHSTTGVCPAELLFGRKVTVLDEQGNSLLLESDQGVTYKRNITHVKKFEKPYERTIEERDQRDNIVEVRRLIRTRAFKVRCYRFSLKFSICKLRNITISLQSDQYEIAEHQQSLMTS